MTLQPGQQIAHYRVVEKIGEGGMGEVWRAEDTRLGREVALKVLPPEVAGDGERRARFEREARSVAALNHPNIVTIHSVEEVDGLHFLSMELVDGRTLTEMIPTGGLTLAKLFPLALPLAEALAAAHEQGITHRDLKPDNIMVDAGGRLKVLDFGLAKLREESQPAGRSETQLPTASVTQEGKILGTASYMSPEQAEGKPVDPRSDVFSLGIILYEMATGRRPFQGDTPISTISAILKDQPQSITDINRTLPRHLGRIVKRALAKDPQRRYQSALELRNELELLKEEIDSGELPLTSAGAATAVAPSTRWGTWLGVAAVALAATAVAIVSFRGIGSNATDLAGPAPDMRLTEVTQDGVGDATISPDGSYVVYAREDGTGDGLWVQQLATGSNVQIVSNSPGNLWGLTFSPDGNYVYYNKNISRQDRSDLYRIPALGGTPQLMIEDVGTRISFSPDGRMTFGRGDSGVGTIIVVNADGSSPQEIARREDPESFSGAPAWSPDGLVIADTVGTWENGPRERIVTLPAAGGPETVVTPEPWAGIGDPVWLPDGSGLIAPARRGYFDRNQLWLFPYPAGVPRRITNDLSNYTEPVLTADGNTLIAMRRDQRAGIWLASGGGMSDLKVLVPESPGTPGVAGLTWTPSGDLVYTAFGSGTASLWAISSEGGTPRPITRGDDPELEPVLAPDGSIVFSSLRDGSINIWRSDARGGNVRQLTEGFFNVDGEVTADGKWLVYLSLETRDQILYKVPFGGGDPIQILDAPFRSYTLSPDGTRLAVRFVDPSTNKFETDIRTLDGELVASPRGMPNVPRCWSPDGTSLHYVAPDEAVENLWAWPLDGSGPTRLTSFDDPDVGICGVSWSHDGKQLAVVRCRRSSSAVMFSDFR